MRQVTSLVLATVLLVLAYWATVAQLDPGNLVLRLTAAPVVRTVADWVNLGRFLEWVGLGPPDQVPATDTPATGPRLTAWRYVPAASSTPEGTTKVTLFFSDPEARLLVPVSRTIRRTPTIIRATLDELLAGPAPDTGLIASVPALEYRKLVLTEGTLTMDLTEQAQAAATGWGSTGSTQALAALIQTLGGHPAVQRITFQVEGRPTDTVFHGLTATPPFEAPDWTSTPRSVVAYLAAQAGDRVYLVPARVTVAASTAREAMGAALELLKVGIETGEYRLAPTLPDNLAIRGLEQIGQVVQVDLDAAAVAALAAEPGRLNLAVDALVFTLTGFPGVQAVELRGDGLPIELVTAAGNLAEPLRRPAWINPETAEDAGH